MLSFHPIRIPHIFANLQVGPENILELLYPEDKDEISWRKWVLWRMDTMLYHAKPFQASLYQLQKFPNLELSNLSRRKSAEKKWTL